MLVTLLEAPNGAERLRLSNDVVLTVGQAIDVSQEVVTQLNGLDGVKLNVSERPAVADKSRSST